MKGFKALSSSLNPKYKASYKGDNNKKTKESREGRRHSKKSKKWKHEMEACNTVNLKKITQGQNRHYICIKYYFIFTYYYKMKIIFS